MKRIILGILALLVAWQLIQLPSVNAALFAFLALGIDPVTNHPFSTASLISILLTLSFVSLLLLFSRFLGDFFGGLSDWLTQANYSYGASATKSADSSTPLTLSSLPARTAIEDLVEPQPVSVTAALANVVANIRILSVPTFGLHRLSPYITRLGQHYGALIDRARSRLQARRATNLEEQVVPALKQSQVYDESLAPELAEVVAIFERLALEAEAAVPQEAVVVEPVAPREPSAFFVAFQNMIMRLHELLGMSGRVIERDARRALVQTDAMIKAAEQQASVMGKKMGVLSSRMLRATYHGMYRAVLLSALGLLIAGGVALHALHVTLQAVTSALVYSYRRACQALVFCAVTITLVMFALGRGIIVMVHATGHGLATLSRGVYKVLALGTMLVLLGAGYLLFVFSLTCFIVWEICEPYARKLDKALGNTLDSKEGIAEMSKVGREMSRTFAQWYREVRQIMHSTTR